MPLGEKLCRPRRRPCLFSCAATDTVSASKKKIKYINSCPGKGAKRSQAHRSGQIRTAPDNELINDRLSIFITAGVMGEIYDRRTPDMATTSSLRRDQLKLMNKLFRDNCEPLRESYAMITINWIISGAMRGEWYPLKGNRRQPFFARLCEALITIIQASKASRK